MGISVGKCGRVWGLRPTPLCYIFGYVYIRMDVTKWVDRYLFLGKLWDKLW